MDPFSHLNCDKVDCTIVKDLQVGHALAIQQRKELLALIHGAPIDVSKAVFGTSSNAEVESMVNSLLGAVESCQTAYKGFLLSRSQAHRRSCKPVRSSQENSTKKPVCALLLHGNITFHTNQFQDDIPCFAGRSAQRSNVREVLEYSGPNDPTLTEAATWNELMEIC